MPMIQKYGSKKDIKQILLRMKLKIDLSSENSEQDNQPKINANIPSNSGSGHI
jgi:hypothetical protein